MKRTHLFAQWLPLVITITLLAGLTYGVGQFILRTSANDPQVEMAQAATDQLAQGSAPASVLPSNVVDITHSLSPYIIVLDRQGNVLASSVRLLGTTPSIPSGVLRYTLVHSEDRVTWEPQPGVRSAVVVRHFSGNTQGFVIAGRSLAEIENRESTLLGAVFVGWLITLSIISLIILLVDAPRRLLAMFVLPKLKR